MRHNDAGGVAGGGGVWGGIITNDVLKFRQVIEFESSCVVIYFSYSIYLIIDGKITLLRKCSSKEVFS